MKVNRLFLGWDKPLVQLAVDQLTSSWADGVLDLTNTLVVVPTTQSGRHLREHLARRAAERGTGVLPPQTVTPDFFLRSIKATNTARTTEMTAIWAGMLMTIDLNELPSLFPFPPESRDDSRWGLGVARKIMQVRSLLSENGLLLKDVAAQSGEIVEEQQRWFELAALEKVYIDKLKGLGLEDVHLAKVKSLKEPLDLNGVDTILLIGVPDPTPFSVTAITNRAKKMKVESWIHAPQELADHFDEWGRPLAEPWNQYNITFPNEEANIRVTANLESMSDDIIGLLKGIQAEEGRALDLGSLALAAPNKNSYSFLSRVFSDYGVDVYNPEGESITRSALYDVLKTMGDIVRQDEYSAVAALIRNSEFISYLSGISKKMDVVKLLTQLDKLQNIHMPQSLKDVERALSYYEDTYFELTFAVKKVREFVELFKKQRPLAFLRKFLSGIYKARNVSSGSYLESQLMETAHVVNEVLAELDSPVFDDLLITPQLQLDLLFQTLGSKSIYPDHGAQSLPVQGWLEMAYDPAGIVIVAGMNEGFLPESVVGDVFLPDLPRVALGLSNNSKRFARDIYLLESLIQSRNGNVYCCVPKADFNGDPLKPSRILFRCADDVLLGRATRLFAEPEEIQTEPVSHQVQWLLKPEKLGTPAHLSATAFKDYLSCPFRFYLKRVLRMDHLDDRKTEADALEFGNACHYALEMMARDGMASTCTDQHVLANFLQNAALEFFRGPFGDSLSLALTVQLDTLQKRLGKVAEVEIASRNEGWKTIEAEYELGGGEGVEVDGILIKGKLDRIDQRDNDIRIIDYKTSDSSDKPEKTHIASAGKNSPEYSCFEIGGKERSWKDLQLPLYRLLLERDPAFMKYRITCGYFTIPKALTDTQIMMWDDLDDELLEAADLCMKKIISNIKKHVFWPPRDSVPFDSFEELYHDTLVTSVDADYMTNEVMA